MPRMHNIEHIRHIHNKIGTLILGCLEMTDQAYYSADNLSMMHVFSNCIKTKYVTNFYLWAMDVECLATTYSIIFRILQLP